MRQYKLYSLDNEFLEEASRVPRNFTGIVRAANNSEFWYKNGKKHRLDGPAHVPSQGNIKYYIEGIKTTKEQHDLYIDLLKLKGII